MHMSIACGSVQVNCPVCEHTYGTGRPFRENTFFPQREQFLAATADKLLNFTPIPLPHTHALHNSEGRNFSPADPAPSSESRRSQSTASVRDIDGSMEIMRTPSPSEVCGDEPGHSSAEEDSTAHAETHNGSRTVVSIDLRQARQPAAPTSASDSTLISTLISSQRPKGEPLSYVDARQVALQRVAAYSQVSPRRCSGAPAHTDRHRLASCDKPSTDRCDEAAAAPACPARCL